MSAKTAITSLVLASALSSALATLASAAPLTDGGKGRCDSRPQGEVLRRRPEGTERLRRRTRHDLPGYLDRRFPRQLVEVRPGRNLHLDRAAERQARISDGYVSQRATCTRAPGNGDSHDEKS